METAPDWIDKVLLPLYPVSNKKTLTELQILVDTHESHLLSKSLIYVCNLTSWVDNKAMGDMTIPRSLWSCSLGQQQQPLPTQQQIPKFIPGQQRTKGLACFDPQTPIVSTWITCTSVLQHRPDLVRSSRASILVNCL
jgi:hypothetical protein